MTRSFINAAQQLAPASIGENLLAQALAEKINAGTRLYHEALTGIQDGVNTSFYAQGDYVDAGLLVFRNGQQQIADQDYNIDAEDTRHLVFVDAPDALDSLTCIRFESVGNLLDASGLQTQIDQEESRAVSAETSLQTQITDILNLMSTDAERIAAITVLVSAYQDADALLNDTLTAALTDKSDIGHQHPAYEAIVPASIHYDVNGRISSIVENVDGQNRTHTLTYHANNTVNTETVVYNGVTQVKTYIYTDGKVTRMTVT